MIAIHTPNYGFKYNASRDGYEVDEEACGWCGAFSAWWAPSAAHSTP